MGAALASLLTLTLIGGLCLAALRQAFCSQQDEDQSWTAPPPSETATIIELNDIRRKRAA